MFEIISIYITIRGGEECGWRWCFGGSGRGGGGDAGCGNGGASLVVDVLLEVVVMVVFMLENHVILRQLHGNMLFSWPAWALLLRWNIL